MQGAEYKVQGTYLILWLLVGLQASGTSEANVAVSVKPCAHIIMILGM